MAQEYLPTAMYVIFAGALVSAILSTVDSSLLGASALLSHNVLMTARRINDEGTKVRIERWAVVGLGIIAYVLAMYAEGVYDLVKDAAPFGSAGIFVTFIFGMYSWIGTERSALAALITGAVLWVIGHYAIRFELSYLLSLSGAFAAFVLFLRKGDRSSTPANGP